MQGKVQTFSAIVKRRHTEAKKYIRSASSGQSRDETCMNGFPVCCSFDALLDNFVYSLFINI